MSKSSGLDTGKLVDLAILGAVGFGAYKLYDLFNTGASGSGHEQSDPRLDPSVEVPSVSEVPTMTRENARIQADKVYVAVYGDGGLFTGNTAEDEEAAIGAMLTPRNASDVLLVVDEYGIRSGWWSLHGDMDLVATLRTYLSPDDLARINLDYSRRGINIRL